MVLCACDVETAGLGTKFLIGCLIIERRKKPIYFYTAESMFRYIENLIKREWKQGDGEKHRNKIDRENKQIDYRNKQIEINNKERVKEGIKPRQLLKRKRYSGHNVYLFAHNGSYDYNNILKKQWGNLVKDKRLVLYTNNPFFGILDKSGYLLDTKSFFKTKLENVGKMIDLPKIETPEELKDPNKKWNRKEIDKLKPYLYRDTEIVFKAMIRFKDVLGEISHKPKRVLTAAQVSLNYFLYWANNKKTSSGSKYVNYLWWKGRIRKQTRYNSFIRMALRGARCEAFGKGYYKEATILDINALYPTVMAKMNVPDILTEREVFPDGTNDDWILNHVGVAEATMISPTKDVMYLPIRYNYGGKRTVIYPHSCKMRAFWTCFEIKRAMEEGYKLDKIHKAVIYDDLPIPIFKEYMEEMYAKRMTYKKRGDKLIEKAVKILMNSLWGKMAMFKGIPKYEIAHRRYIDKYINDGFEVRSELNEDLLFYKELPKRLPRYAHPMIAIQTLAYARDEIYKQLCKTPIKDLLYCDTDSVVLTNTKKHIKKYVLGTKLGELKVEKKGDAYIFKEKVYRVGDKCVFSGFPSICRDEFEDLIKGKPKEIKVQYTIKKGLKTGRFDKVGDFVNKQMHLSTKRKREIEYEPEIREYLKEEYMTAEETSERD
jgi:hypothetical protein